MECLFQVVADLWFTFCLVLSSVRDLCVFVNSACRRCLTDCTGLACCACRVGDVAELESFDAVLKDPGKAATEVCITVLQRPAMSSASS